MAQISWILHYWQGHYLETDLGVLDQSPSSLRRNSMYLDWTLVSTPVLLNCDQSPNYIWTNMAAPKSTAHIQKARVAPGRRRSYTDKEMGEFWTHTMMDPVSNLLSTPLKNFSPALVRTRHGEQCKIESSFHQELQELWRLSREDHMHTSVQGHPG